MSKPTEKNNGLLPYLEVKYLRAQIPAKIINKGLYLPNNSNVILVDGENSGEVFNTKENGYMGSTFMQLIISKYVNHSYIKFFIASKKELLKNNKKGSAIPHLNKEIFNNLEIYLPPITEQNKIVKTLNNIINSLNIIKAEL